MISFGCFYFRQAGYASGSVRSCFCVCVCRDNFKKMSADFDEIFWVDSFLGQERTILPLQEGSELQSGSARGPLRRGCFAGSKGMRYTEFTATGWSRKIAQSSMYRKFSTVSHRDMRFSPKYSNTRKRAVWT